MVKSIFDLEKRTNLKMEVARLDSYLQQEVFIFYRGQYEEPFIRWLIVALNYVLIDIQQSQWNNILN